MTRLAGGHPTWLPSRRVRLGRCYSAFVQAEVAARLALPLPPDAATWGVAEVAPEGAPEGAPRGARARLLLYAAREAVTARLDAECGTLGWSFTLAPLGASALVANLTLQGVTRAVVVPALAVGVASSGDLALAACARSFGLGLPFVTEHESYWVDFDPESNEPLYLPEPVVAGRGVVPSGPRAGEGVGAVEGRAGGPTLEPAAGDGGAAALEQRLEARNGNAGAGAGHQVIERLVERLKELGLGKEAARLVIRYQGYGRTPEESRELYGRLRAMLPGVGAP